MTADTSLPASPLLPCRAAPAGRPGTRAHPADFLRLSLASAAAVQAAQIAALAASKALAGQGFRVDPAEKTAVEMRAIEAARSHYAGLGWAEDPADAGAYKHESFDLILHRDGEVKHVEV